MSLPLHLMRYDDHVVIVRLGPDEEPSWDWRRGPLYSLTVTDSETSVVCAADGVPADVRQQGPLTAFEVAGPLDFTMVGVLAGLLEPLARQGISILAFSTFDTDWILVAEEHTTEVETTWRKAGFTVAPARLSGGNS